MTTRLRHTGVVLLLALLLPACAGTGGTDAAGTHAGSAVQDSDPRAADVRELIAESARRAVNDLARFDGYARRPETHIPMPAALAAPTAVMRGYGYARVVDAFQADMNRGLERAAGMALPRLLPVIAQLPVPDVDALLQDRTPRATGLLCTDNHALLDGLYREALAASLTQAGYTQSLDILVRQFNGIPALPDMAVPDIEPELRRHGLNGLCLRMAAEETRLRREPDLRPAGAIQRLLGSGLHAHAACDPADTACTEPVATAATPPPPPPATRAERRQERLATQALQELLARAAGRAGQELAKPGGFQKNPRIRIGLPPALNAATERLAAAGQGALAEKLATELNVAAEITLGAAAPQLAQAVAVTRFSGARFIAAGEDTAATAAFRQQTEAGLRRAITTLVNDNLRRSGSQDSLNALTSAYYRQSGTLVTVNLEPWLRDRLLDGFYVAVGEQERAIRHDPARQDSKALRRVFSPGN